MSAQQHVPTLREASGEFNRSYPDISAHQATVVRDVPVAWCHSVASIPSICSFCDNTTALANGRAIRAISHNLSTWLETRSIHVSLFPRSIVTLVYRRVGPRGLSRPENARLHHEHGVIPYTKHVTGAVYACPYTHVRFRQRQLLDGHW
jgi:deferrochelatase/peroxidase EfeB